MNMHLPILTYHSIDETGSPVSVSTAIFRQHLQRLQVAGYEALPLGEALARLGQAESAARRTVALTFDDGYASTYEVALPLLRSYGWRGTVFAVSDYVGRDNAWPGQPAFVPPARLLSWIELAELARLGWEVGAHSRTHPDLTQLDEPALHEEVHRAKAALQDRLGEAVRTYAYPYGQSNARVRKQVRSAFSAACTTTMRIASQRSDRYGLERLDMWYFSGKESAPLLASRWMRPYVGLCRVGRLVRAGLVRAGV